MQSFRYRLIPFTEADASDSEKLFLSIREVDHGAARYLSLAQWDAVVAHLAKLGTKSLLVQSEVRDPDFLEEYEAFYARQHRQVSRHCIRLHAFSTPPLAIVDGSTQEKIILDFVDAAPKDSYLGFSTIRPLRHAPVGPTILADCPSARSQAKDKFPVHIAGQSFCVEGTPFMQQDNAVGACAQASIWMALRTMRRRAGNAAYSPAELTLSGTRLDRVSPGRHALSVKQMLDALQASGHDSLVISVAKKEPNELSDHQVVLDAALPYVQSGIPVIMVLRHPITEGHTVVAIGEACEPEDPNRVTQLVVHNDNAGPYQLLPANVSDGSREYALNHTNSLIVPLPNGVTMSAAEAESQAKATLEFWLPSFGSELESNDTEPELVNFKYRSYLCSRHAFRRWARECKELNENDRQAYRTKELPHQIWVVEVHSADSFSRDLSEKTRLGEVVLDAGADALHGDGVMHVRLTHHMFKSTQKTGGVLITDANSLIFSEDGPACYGVLSPWAEDEVAV
jgi:hypothetical protein